MGAYVALLFIAGVAGIVAVFAIGAFLADQYSKRAGISRKQAKEMKLTLIQIERIVRDNMSIHGGMTAEQSMILDKIDKVKELA